MKLCLVKIVLMLLMTNYKEKVEGNEMEMSSGASENASGEGSSTEPFPNCTRKYPVSYDWGAPVVPHTLNFTNDTSMTAEQCQEWCSADAWCKSVTYGGAGKGGCAKHRVSLQELIEARKDYAIYLFPRPITYDRDCAEPFNCTSNKYPVSHDRQVPHGKYAIKSSSWIFTLKKCQKFCSEDADCKSVAYDESKHLGCVKYNVSLQEIRDTGKKDEIILWLGPITYDRDCAAEPFPNCTREYPVTHDNQKLRHPGYVINRTLYTNATAETCQEWCSADVRCKSVTYIEMVDSAECVMNRVSFQELIDAGKQEWIILFNRPITYDRDCAEPFPNCTREYPVSHDGELLKKYAYEECGYDRKLPNGTVAICEECLNATAKMCQECCSADAMCRSVVRMWWWNANIAYCVKFNVSLQEIRDAGKEDEIIHFDRYITYDRDCSE